MSRSVIWSMLCYKQIIVFKRTTTMYNYTFESNNTLPLPLENNEYKNKYLSKLDFKKLPTYNDFNDKLYN